MFYFNQTLSTHTHQAFSFSFSELSSSHEIILSKIARKFPTTNARQGCLCLSSIESPVNSKNWADLACQLHHCLNIDDNANIDTWTWGTRNVKYAKTTQKPRQFRIDPFPTVNTGLGNHISFLEQIIAFLSQTSDLKGKKSPLHVLSGY